jgi:hypothetical protein
MHAAFEEYLFPCLAHRIEKAVAAGETIDVHDSRVRACVQILFGVRLIFSAPVVVILIRFRGHGPEVRLFGPGTDRICVGFVEALPLAEQEFDRETAARKQLGGRSTRQRVEITGSVSQQRSASAILLQHTQRTTERSRPGL